jgi:muramidase (phage lysozyme)
LAAGRTQADSKYIAAQRPILPMKPVRFAPKLQKRLLYHILRRQRISEQLPQEIPQTCPILPVETVKTERFIDSERKLR